MPPNGSIVWHADDAPLASVFGRHPGESGNAGSKMMKQRLSFLKLETTVVLSEDKRKSLLACLSGAVTRVAGKPEQQVIVTVGQATMLMSGDPGAAA
jgi:hypothetical protein